MNTDGFGRIRGRISVRIQAPLRALATAAPWIVATLFCGGDRPALADVARVFMDAPDGRSPITPRSPSHIRARTVKIQLTELANLRDTGGGRLTLNLFGDADFTAIVEHVATHFGGFSLAGRLHGVEYGRFNLVVQDNAVAGVIRTGQGATYSIRHLGEDTHVVRQIDPAAFPPCGVTPTSTNRFHEALAGSTQNQAIAAASSPSSGSVSSADDGSALDILVLYSDVTRQAAGGHSAIRAEIRLAVDVANEAYGDSGIASRMRLVHMEEVTYDEATGWDGYQDHLVRLGVPDDGFFDHIHELRDRVGADFVSLIVEDTDPDLLGNGTCGLAPVMQELSPDFDVLAFSVVSRECAADNWTLAHEVGHNQGCAHNRENASVDGLFTYSYGYHLTGDTRGWSTMMAYNDANNNWQRFGQFSNPYLTHDGAATGVHIGSPGEAHNVSTINSTRTTIARFRETRYWVDFDWSGIQNGLFNSPYGSLPDGLLAVPDGGVVVIKSGFTGDGLVLTKQSQLSSWNGPAVIGAIGP